MNPDNKDEDYPILATGTVKNREEKVKHIGRPTIFVGSSMESKPIAEKLKQCFPPDEFEVDIWYDGVFGRTRSKDGNLSNMEWLKNFTDIYDFAIFIFVPEDSIVSATRKNLQNNEPHLAQVTRHNVVFEYGMFLGRVGAKRSFILFDREVKDFIDLFFTDLKENLDDTKNSSQINDQFRIELYNYKGNYKRYLQSGFKESPYDAASIEEAIEKIKMQIRANFEKIDISFLPATTLAFGYYNNFIQAFVRSVNLLKGDAHYPDNWQEQGITEKELDDFRRIVRESEIIKLKIVVPTSIEGTRQEKFIPDFNNNKFLPIKFPGGHRAIILLKLGTNTPNQKKEWVIYDVPTTLNSSIEAIEMMTPHDDIRELLKEKELRNFRKSIDYKLLKAKKQSDTANIDDLVTIISYDSFIKETH